MSTSYDENEEYELSQEDARIAARALAGDYQASVYAKEAEAILRVIAALTAFASGSTNIVPEE